MSLPDISFENIRTFDGSQNGGFEEMCCQLAALEETGTREAFHRKGRGGDAGVECYCRRTDGTEVGWQAKYLFRWSNSLNTQLNDSIRRALDKHPNLVEYVVCLPFDLSDSRTSTGKTARESWDVWCSKSKKFAASQERDLTITLWGKSELTSRLVREDPAYSGRLLYWFGREALTEGWFREQFGKARASLGSRYTPDTNVELPIRQDFLAFARHPDLQKQIHAWFLRVSAKGSNAVDAICRTGYEAAKIHSADLTESVRALTSLLDRSPIGPDQPYPLADWSIAVSNCLNLSSKALRWSYDLPPSESNNFGITSERLAQRTLHELMELLSEIKDALASNSWQLTNKKAVLLHGPAGIGKSHLLADIVEHHLHHDGQALLLLGGSFVDSEPWPQIRDQLDLPTTEQFKHFLGSLDAAAQAVGMRAIVCIDALNERHGSDVWPERLPAFLKAFEAFPRVSLILSCRSTYVPHVIPDDLDEDHLFPILHQGFATDGGEAAKVYLDKRGMVRPGTPNIVHEFQNPLFLKTCCDSLTKAKETEFPKGMRGVTSIFNFYYEAVTQSINHRMKLDIHQEIVPTAITKFSQMLANSDEACVPKYEAIALFESILFSGGNRERSLLNQLENEGILTIESMRQVDGSHAEMVRFTFERFSDHAIASHLLDNHLKTDDVASSFQVGNPLYEYVFGSKICEWLGIVEAMAIQLPERTGIEILDVGSETHYVVHQAFLRSLLWREQSHFTDRTFELVKKLVETDELNDLLVSISTEPSNKYNALFVHNHLLELTMPERDEIWSVYLAERDFKGPVETLISWALQNDHVHIDEDRVYLAATMLTWFFTTSHREIRDKASKALANLLSRRLLLAARLLKDFGNVNDLYVLERLLAACYGAALQGVVDTGLRELSQVVFDLIFSKKQPPVHLLLRDHARGIVEYADSCCVLNSSIDLALARPPYKSPWPIEPVPDKLIDSYTHDRRHGAFRDAIVGSAADEMGDFAKYVIEGRVTRWSPAKIGTDPLPSSLDVCKDWIQEFLEDATSKQRNIIEDYLRLANEIMDIDDHQPDPKTARLDSVEVALRQTMTSDQWEDFRVRARDSIRHGSVTSRAAHFNVSWGRRWICMRAHELGWTPDRFGHFDDHSVGYGRNNHRLERIGKKYQWLALHELIARMADNLAPLDSREPEATDERSRNWFARTVRLRDIDPSFLTTRTHYDGWREWDKTWWVPIDRRLRPMDLHERLAWLEGESDIIKDCTLIDLYDPRARHRWLALSGFSRWSGDGVRSGKKEIQRDNWFRLTCVVVHRQDQSKMIESLKGKILTDPSSFPEIELLSNYFYLGEYPWFSEIAEFDQWSSYKDWQNFPVPIRPTVASYVCESQGYDQSIDQTINIRIPAPWLLSDMGMRLSSGRFPIFVNSDGEKVFYDPSIVECGPGAALVDRDTFLRELDRKGLSAIWVIAGEKNVFSGSNFNLKFGGSLRYTTLCHLDGDGFACCLHTDRIHPTKGQLHAFFGKDPIPAGVETRPAELKA